MSLSYFLYPSHPSQDILSNFKPPMRGDLNSRAAARTESPLFKNVVAEWLCVKCRYERSGLVYMYIYYLELRNENVLLDAAELILS